MARNPTSKLPLYHKSGRRGSSRHTSGSNTSRRSSSRSTSTVATGPNTPHVQIQQGPHLDSTSTHTTAEGTSRNAVGCDEDSGDDTLDEVILAVDLTPRGTVGCCYYVARDETLYFMEDIEFGDVDVVDSCKFNVSQSCNDRAEHYQCGYSPILRLY